MTWTDEKLAQLPVSSGFRLRGLDMTRLETFCDSAFASYASGGRLPTEFVLTDPREMLALLHVRGLKAGADLGLDAVERLRTRQEIVMNLVLAGTGMASAVWAVALPPARSGHLAG